jgi:hypothetical protein
MMTAEVCYKRLTPAVRERANALIKLNPLYHEWETQIGETHSQAEKDEQMFMLASTWADTIKRGHGYESDGPNGGNRPGGPEASQNLGYSDKLLHKYWHYCDRPYTQDGSKLRAMAEPNAMTQIEAFRKVLASPDTSDDVRSYDLVWVMHMVGDIHQPLHCITRLSSADPDGDNGGNNVKIRNNDYHVLHAFWDECLGEEQSPAKIPASVRQLSKAKATLAADENVKDWANESYNFAIEKVYSGPVGKHDGPYWLTSKYKRTARNIARERIELAGERLAKLLNENLKTK